jgi:hypothetical protein
VTSEIRSVHLGCSPAPSAELHMTDSHLLMEMVLRFVCVVKQSITVDSQEFNLNMSQSVRQFECITCRFANSDLRGTE